MMVAPGRASWGLRLGLLVLVASHASLATAFPVYPKKERLLTTVGPRFNLTHEKALLDFKNALGNNTNSVAGWWGATWISGNACTSWQFTSCDASGNLLQLLLSGKQLEGVIPQSFYTITTLTKLDLSNNRLYGGVQRNLATINQNLVYLDLSSNFFTGRWPDQWFQANITQPRRGTNLTATNAGQRIYINITYTYFTGYQTLNTSNKNTSASPLNCVGVTVSGDVSYSCLTVVISIMDRVTEGACQRANFINPQLRSAAECYPWCATSPSRPSVGPCFNRLNAVCKPTFASLTNSSVTNRSCTYPPASPASPPPPPVSGNATSADAASLGALYVALGSPSKLSILAQASTQACSKLSPYVTCNSLGNVISLNLGGLGLAQQVIPTVISSFSALQSLSLSKNNFYGSWPFDLRTQLVNLVVLDLSANFLTGAVPSRFASLPTFVNYSSNYFTGDPTVQDALGNVYCPYAGIVTWAQNCLSVVANSPCPGEAQRTAAQCAAYCNILTTPYADSVSSIASFRGACGNGAGGVCTPAAAGKWQCSGTVPPPPPPPPSAGGGSPPVYGTQLRFFADTYINKFKSASSIFSTWQTNLNCDGVNWAGLTCDPFGFLLAVNLSGKGLVGPFPGPTLLQELFWTYPGYVSPVRILDFSSNSLYGLLDPALSTVTNMDYMDFSNNFFTGPLPAQLTGSFRYVSFAGNYLYGKPAVPGLDGVSASCPGIAFGGSWDKNCFDLPAIPATSCPQPPIAKDPKLCQAFCPGGATSAGPCAKSKTGQVCKPSGSGSFTCTKQ